MLLSPILFYNHLLYLCSLFSSSLQKEVMLSKEWCFLWICKTLPVPFQSTSAPYTCRLSWLPEFNLHPSVCRSLEQPTEFALIWAISFPKSCLVQFLEYSLWEISKKWWLECANSTSSRFLWIPAYPFLSYYTYKCIMNSHMKFKKRCNFTCEQPHCVLSRFAICECICAQHMQREVSAWLTRASSIARQLTAACTVSWSFSLYSPINCSYLTPPYPYTTRAATLWHQSVFCLLTWLRPQGKSCTWVYDRVSGHLETPSALKSWLRV